MADKARNGRFMVAMAVLMAVSSEFLAWSMLRGAEVSAASACAVHASLFLFALSVPAMRVLVTSGRDLPPHLLRAGGFAASFFMMLFLAACLREAAALGAFLADAAGVMPCALRDVLLSGMPFPWGGAAMSAASAAAVAALTACAARPSRIIRYDIRIPGLPAGLEGLRIAHAGDLHGGPSVSAGRIAAMAEAVRRERPDLLCLTGDFADGAPSRDAALMEPVLSLGRGMPVFICMGNHDMYHDPAAWRRLWSERGFHVLLNSHSDFSFGGTVLRVAGISDTGARAVPGEMLPDMGAALGEGGVFTVLLAHRPGCAHEAARRGVSLQLSGHTHGGQMAFLFPLVSFVNGGFRRGLYRVGGMVLHVTSGCGCWSYAPMRMGVSSEIAVLTLRSL